MNKNIYNKGMIYSQFQQGFMFGIINENHINVIIFSTTVLVCYVYDTVKMHMEKKKRPLIKKNDKCI